MASGNASACGVPTGMVLCSEVVLSRKHRGSENATAQAVGRRVSRPRPLDPTGSGRRVSVPIEHPRLLSYAPKQGLLTSDDVGRLTCGQSDCFDKKKPLSQATKGEGLDRPRIVTMCNVRRHKDQCEDNQHCFVTLSTTTTADSPMNELTPLEYGIVHYLRSDLDIKEVRFESFGAEQKAIVRLTHRGQEVLCWLRPTESDSLIVALKMVAGRKPRHHPHTRLTETVEPTDAPDATTTLVKRVRRARGDTSAEMA